MRTAGKRALVALTFIGAVGFGMHVARGQAPPPMQNQTGTLQTPPANPTAAPTNSSQQQIFYAPTPMPTSTPSSAATQVDTGNNENFDESNFDDAPPSDSEPLNANPQRTGTVPSSQGMAPPPMPPIQPGTAGTPAPYVPSEVETILPLPTRLNEPRVIFHTSAGVIRGKLFATRVPQSVTHFMNLVRGELEFVDVSSGKKVIRPFYENMIFHRVVAGYLIQTGCPFGNGRGGPGFAIKDEFRPNLRFNKPGMIAMAPQRNGSVYVGDSIGSQFFITAAAAPEFDDKATIIGEVTEGMDIVRKISRAPANPLDKPIRPIQLEKIEIIDEVPAKP